MPDPWGSSCGFPNAAGSAAQHTVRCTVVLVTLLFDRALLFPWRGGALFFGCVLDGHWWLLAAALAAPHISVVALVLVTAIFVWVCVLGDQLVVISRSLLGEGGKAGLGAVCWESAILFNSCVHCGLVKFAVIWTQVTRY